jgi:2-(1,2-epoxy-1,2-dihydrophenyl)acetyl-CoA isomerase
LRWHKPITFNGGIFMKDIIFEKKDHVALLTLNRPEKSNAINVNIEQGVDKICSDIKKDDSVRALIITGAGHAFCAGVDLSNLPSGQVIPALGEETRYYKMQPIGYFLLSINKLEKPVIAAVNGVAAGAGLSIAIACDIRIASDKSRFGAIWVKRGLVPDGGASYFLPRIIGLSKTFEITMQGKMIDAKEAKEIGLVNMVVPHDELLSQAKDLATQIASNAPIAMEMTKKIISMGLNNSLESQLNIETGAQERCFKTEDFREGLKSFKEKREPIFRGK